MGERRNCQSVHVGPQLRLCGCRDAQLTLPVLICRPRRGRAVLCMKHPWCLGQRLSEVVLRNSPVSAALYCQDGE